MLSVEDVLEILSLPLIAFGIWLIWRARRKAAAAGAAPAAAEKG